MPRTARDLHDYLSHPTTLLPEPLPLEEVIANIRQSHEQGGGTFSRYFGDAVGQPLYAVSVYPDRLARQVEVLTEGTGEEVSGLPTPLNRLPALKRRRQRKNNG